MASSCQPPPSADYTSPLRKNRPPKLHAELTFVFRFETAWRKVPRPINSPTAKSGQWKGRGIPPAETLRKSQVKARQRTSPDAKNPTQCSGSNRTGRPIHSLVKYKNPAPLIHKKPRTATNTAAAQGTGSRNSKSQARNESAQPTTT